MSELSVYPDENTYGIRSEIHRAIHAYVNDPPAGQAILIEGPWGIGKSHYISRAWRERKPAPVRVSLYGAKSADDIELAICAARVRANDTTTGWWTKFASYLSNVVRSLLGLAGQPMPDNAIGATAHAVAVYAKHLMLQSINKRDLIILDDLERCGDPGAAVALAGRLAEQNQARVVVIGAVGEYEQKLDPDARDVFRNQCEKSFRHRYAIERDDTNCFDIIADLYSHNDDFYKFLTTHKLIWVATTKKMQCSNLRILRFAASILHLIFQQHQQILEKHPKQASILVSECLTISIALKAGYKDITPEELEFIVTLGSFLHHVSPRGDQDTTLREYRRELFGRAVSHPSLWEMIAKGYQPSEALAFEFQRWVPDPEQTPLRRLASIRNSTDYDGVAQTIREAVADFKEGMLAELHLPEAVDAADQLERLLCEQAFNMSSIAFEDQLRRDFELLTQKAIDQYDSFPRLSKDYEYPPRLTYGLVVELRNKFSDAMKKRNDENLASMFETDPSNFRAHLAASPIEAILHELRFDVFEGAVRKISGLHIECLISLFEERYRGDSQNYLKNERETLEKLSKVAEETCAELDFTYARSRIVQLKKLLDDAMAQLDRKENRAPA